MKYDHLRIEFSGTEVPELYHDLLSLEVELDDELAGMCRITLALLPGADGSWPYLDDKRFAAWQRLSVIAGFEDDARQLLTGYVTHLRPAFGLGAGQSQLEIWAMDASVLLDRVDRVKAWPNKKDSDIAAEIFQEHGLTPEVADTELVHDERMSTIVQRETDAQLLRRLALRNGFECFVDGDTGHFRLPAADADPQPVLAVQFGDETNVDWFRLEVNALAPAKVSLTQIDHVSGQVLEAQAGIGRQPALGADPAGALQAPGEPAMVRVARTVTTGAAEMSTVCQGHFDRGQWFVTG
ncbi:contractile injection system protein, VgrG/Pvc8 family, partial [Streptomyces sp. NPDC006197]|uniref:phage late control D family protein n=1 Tax=Streptomyces sp. NPDC006197 TaxID=3156685 RepID=UPI0033BA9975